MCDTQPETIIEQQWDLPGLDPSLIGFSICSGCGLVLQNPALAPSEMLRYYSEIATYINPGREGKPTARKVKDVKRMIILVREQLGKMPENAFQVGCSDGYTLNAFRQAGINDVSGLDPSVASHELAKRLYGIHTIVSGIEDFKPENPDTRFRLILLTHILEHLYDPLEALVKCAQYQDESDYILVEVPLFERIERFGPGMLSLEHLNYFSEATMIEALTRANYEPVFIGKYYYINLYPVITILARKNSKVKTQESNDFSRANTILKAYIQQERKSWSQIEQKILAKISKGQKAYIYGAGIHTSQLLAFTNIRTELEITGLLDSSPTKWGKSLGRWQCFNPDSINIHSDDMIIISSYASEMEIYSYLVKRNMNKNQIICLYNDQEE